MAFAASIKHNTFVVGLENNLCELVSNLYYSITVRSIISEAVHNVEQKCNE